MPARGRWCADAATPVDTQGLLNLTFWVHGGATGGQRLQVVAVVNDVAQPAIPIAALAPNTWQRVSVPLSALGADNRNDVNGFWVGRRLTSVRC